MSTVEILLAAVAGFFVGHKVDTGPVELLGQTFPASWAASGVASGCAVLLVYVYLYRTRVGYLTRAVMDNREEAIATGINVHRVSAVAFGIGLGLAAAAGVFAPFMLGSITPAMGAEKDYFVRMHLVHDGVGHVCNERLIHVDGYSAIVSVYPKNQDTDL